jgi:hypothetical protein
VARRCGATHVIEMRDHHAILKDVQEFTDGRGCAIVIEAVGGQWPLDLATDLTAVRGRHLPPTPSALAAGPALSIHFACHVAALGLLALGIVTDGAWLVRLAAIAGTIGAAAFAIFFANVMRRMAGANASAAARVATP